MTHRLFTTEPDAIPLDALQQLPAEENEQNLCEYWTCGASCTKTGAED